jgi:hypothetical protein
VANGTARKIKSCAREFNTQHRVWVRYVQDVAWRKAQLKRRGGVSVIYMINDDASADFTGKESPFRLSMACVFFGSISAALSWAREIIWGKLRNGQL